MIIRNFNKKTLVLERRGRLILDGENENLHSVIIRTLETIIVNDIKVVHGTPRVPASVARGFAKSGCARITGFDHENDKASARGSRANSRGKAKPKAKGRTRPKGRS